MSVDLYASPSDGLSGLLIALLVLAVLILLVAITALRKINALKLVDTPPPIERPIDVVPQAAAFLGCEPGVVAAITAAISCVLAGEGKPTEVGSFVVRRIRRV